MVITVPDTVPVRFTVAFSATDSAAGVRHYDVQFKVGESGVWANWLVDTLKREMDFIGTPGEVYYFRAQATDKVNNVGAWVEVGPVAVKAVTKYYALGGQQVAMRQGEEVYYLHGDHLGSTSLTTDSTGAVVSEIRYHPYGQERWMNGETVTDFGFTGQRNEAGFGLMDYKARYYSAGLGRFVSADSIVPEAGSSGGFNRYAYVSNNPLRYTDPSGHCIPEECPDVPDVELTQDLFDEYGGSSGLDRYYYGDLVRQGLERDAAGTGRMAWVNELDRAVAFDQTMVLMKEGPLDEMMYEEMIQTIAMAGGSLANSFSTHLASSGLGVIVLIPRSRYPEAAQHIEEAQAAGHPDVLTIDRTGAPERRKESLEGYPAHPQYDRDEYPPAMFEEGGVGASVRYIDKSDNRGAGACIGNACRTLPDGTRVQIVVIP